MNNQNQSWKCPNCDTINTTRRCVVCGEEQPIKEVTIKSTVPTENEIKKRKQNKSLIIALSVSCGVLLVALIIALVFLFTGSKEETKKSEETVVSHKLDTPDDEPKKDKSEKKDEYISDAVYGLRFNLSADKQKMEKKPEFVSKENEYITFKAPKNFKSSDNSRYFAYDNTAYIEYKIENSAEKTAEQWLNETKSKIGGSVTQESANDEFFAFSSLRNGVIYYAKGINGNGKAAIFTFVYPEEYRDIYDDYIAEISEGFSLIDTSGIEVIEE